MKIKSITKFNRYNKAYSFNGEDLSNNPEVVESVIEMDNRGNIVVEKKFDSDGNPEEENRFTYNSGGKLILHELVYLVDQVMESTVYNRNGKGLLIEERKMYGDEYGERTEMEYNEKDLLTVKRKYDEEGILISIESFEYNDNGDLTEHLIKDGDGKMEAKFLFTKTGNKVEQCYYGPSGELFSKSIHTLNDKGEETESEEFDATGSVVSTQKSSFDEFGNVIEMKFEGKNGRLVKYEYDSENRCVVKEYFDLSGILVRKNMFTYNDQNLTAKETVYELSSGSGRDRRFESRFEYTFFES